MAQAKRLFGNENVWVEMHRGIPIEVEPLDETQLKDLGLNTCNHDILLSYREIPNFDESEPQPQPFPSFPYLEVDLGEERGLELPIKPPSPDSFRMKEVDHLTNHTPPSLHVYISFLVIVYLFIHVICFVIPFSVNHHGELVNTIRILEITPNPATKGATRTPLELPGRGTNVRIITPWEDLTNRFLAQFFPPGRTAKLHNDILMFQQHQGESLSEAWTPGGKLRDRNAEESWALLEDLALYDNESWNNPRDFAKPVKAISLPQDVLMNKITSSCEICGGPHDTQYCIENPEQAFVDYASSRTDEAGGLVSNFMTSQDARLSKFEADFKQQQSEMTNKIDTVLKAITDRIDGALPSDMVKNPKLNVNSTSSVLSARSYPMENPQCSYQIHSLINTITIHQSNPHNDKPEEDPKNSNAAECKEEQRGTLQLELKEPTDIEKIEPSRNDKEREIEWLDVEEPLDLVDTSEESVYESLIKEMPKCSLNYDFRIKKGDPRNPLNNLHGNRYEYMGRNFIGLGRDMHLFVGNMSYVTNFTILENIETNIDPNLSHVIFGRPFIEITCLAINRKHGLITFTDKNKEYHIKNTLYVRIPEESELSSEGHDLLSSIIILSEDDSNRGYRKPSDLEDGFYRDTIKLGLEYVTGKEDEGEVT
ncbi:MAK10-like protein [Tanacetum coccineum]